MAFIGILLIFFGILCLWTSYRQKNTKYPQLPVGTKPDDYQRTTAVIWDIAQIEKELNSNSRRGYHTITVYNVYVKFNDNEKSVTTKIDYDFHKTDYFEIGQEIEIFYKHYDTSNTSKAWLNMVEKGIQMFPDKLQHNADYTYFAYATDTNIYANEYAKNNTLLLSIMGIAMTIFGIFVLIY